MTIESIGPGGGGTMFSPRISPQNQSLWFVACDLGGVYRSDDAGMHWKMVDTRVVQSSPRNDGTETFSVAFSPSGTVLGYHPVQGLRESNDEGLTWSPRSAPPSAWHVDGTNLLAAAYDSGARLAIATEYRDGTTPPNALFVESGGTWDAGFPTSAPVHSLFVLPIAGVETFFAASQDKVYSYASPTSGWTDVTGTGSSGLSGSILSMSGGMGSSGPVLYAITLNGDVYSIWKSSGTGAWSTTGNPNASSGWFYLHVVTSPMDPQTVYVSGGGPDGAAPNVWRSDDGGATWGSGIYDGYVTDADVNVTGGWVEYDLGWGFGGRAWGLTIDPNDAGTVVVTNQAAVHATTSGTAQTVRWTQRYCQEIGSTTPGHQQRWKTVGLDVTSAWDYLVAGDHHVACCSDIHIQQSNDAGNSWTVALTQSAPDSEEWDNCYQAAMDPANPGRMWAAVSLQHDLPQPKKMIANPYGTVLTTHTYGSPPERYKPRKGPAHPSLGWTEPANHGLNKSLPVTSVIFTDGALYAAVFGDGVYKSIDGAASWTRVPGLDNRIDRLPSYAAVPVESKRAYRLSVDPIGCIWVVCSGTDSATVGGRVGYLLPADGGQRFHWIDIPPAYTKKSGGEKYYYPFDITVRIVSGNVELYVATLGPSGTPAPGTIWKRTGPLSGMGSWVDLQPPSPASYATYPQWTGITFIGGTAWACSRSHGVVTRKTSTLDGVAQPDPNNWELQTEIPFLAVNRVVAGPDGGAIICTFGGGIYRVQRFPPPASWLTTDAVRQLPSRLSA